MVQESNTNPRQNLAWARLARLVVVCAVLGGLIAIGLTQFKRNKSTLPEELLGLIVLPEAGDNSTHSPMSENAPKSLAGKILGAEACRECHRDKYETFIKTAHHQTSSAASAETIAGDFSEANSIVRSTSPSLHFRVGKDEDGFFQEAVVAFQGKEFKHSEQFAVVTGSGKMGQTYLYARGTKLFQLPISYVQELGSWVQSPGFPEDRAIFSRFVGGGCLSCHASYYDDSVELVDFGTSKHIIYGISCERCHGPGADHVEYHRNNPDQRIGEHIFNPKDFSKQRQIELCGQCHSGIKSVLKPPFSYLPGDPLDEYLLLESLDESERLGVHAANQSLRLAESLCFQQSDAMNCTTCHNPHILERGQTALFSKRCQNCHNSKSCGMSTKLSKQFVDHCVECHMPTKFDSGTTIARGGEIFMPRMWDHAIGVYPKLTKHKLSNGLRKLKLATDE